MFLDTAFSQVPPVSPVSAGKVLPPEPRACFGKAAVPELLAPAGSFAAAAAALEHGADAVYAGIENFNLRAHSPNFSIGELCELIDYANGIRKKVYGVLNIMPDDRMLAGIEDTLKELAGFIMNHGGKFKPHGLIVSDPGVLSVIHRIFAGNNGGGAANDCNGRGDNDSIPIHLSTQNGCFNSESMRFWKKQGVTRVILPRELNIGQISRLSSLGIAETEVFIHGAMCVSISGRCLMGTYYNGRHPNLGDCPQPCRFKYKIIPGCGDGVKPPGSPAQDAGPENSGFCAEEDENGVYLLNSKDLCTVSILPAVIETGVSSLKIEGRNKSAHYVASTVKVYRDAIDTYAADPRGYRVKDWWINELENIEHRPYTTGFYDGDPVKQELFSSKAQAGYRLAGTVKAVAGGCPVIDVKNGFSLPDTAGKTETELHDSFNVLPVKHGRAPYDFTFKNMYELDGNQTPCGRAKPNRLVVLDGCSEGLRVGDMLRVVVARAGLEGTRIGSAGTAGVLYTPTDLRTPRKSKAVLILNRSGS